MFLKNFPLSCKMKKRNEKSNTGEAGKDKRGRTVSDDAGGKSLSGGLGGLPGEKVQPRRMPRGTTLTRQWEKVEVMKRKTGNLRTTMRMRTGLQVLPNDHVCVRSVRKNIREDMEDRWVTTLSEDRKRFYLVSSLLDPHTKMLSFCASVIFQWT